MKRTFLLVLAASLLYVTVGSAQQQYPIMDAVANKIIAKYQNSSCEQLWQKKSAKTAPGPEEQKVSMRRSLASILTSTSSASGSTATVTAEV